MVRKPALVAGAARPLGLRGGPAVGLPHGRDTPTAAGVSRMTAQQRREDTLRAAVGEFGRGGYRGTSTHAVAEAVGVSQPYLYRLFGSKERLFAATAEWALGQLVELLRQAARRAAPGRELAGCTEAVTSPSAAWSELLRFELALCGAAAEPGPGRLARRHFAVLRAELAALTGASEEDLRAFFAAFSWAMVSSLLGEDGPIPAVR